MDEIDKARRQARLGVPETLALVAVALAVAWWTVGLWIAHAQEITGIPAYTVSDPAQPDQLLLALDDGRYALELGPGCEVVGPAINVEWLPGSGGVGAIRPLGSQALCNVYLGPRQSDEPCATDDAGVCDVAAEPGS